MKTFIQREVRPPNDEKRRQLLTELAKLRAYPELKELKREFRTELRKTHGSTQYFMYYKGLRILLGGENRSLKFLTLELNSEAIDTQLKQFRSVRKIPRRNNKRVLINSLGDYIYLDYVDGMHSEPQSIFKATKHVRRYKALRGKRPTTNDSYVGIELEYASKLDLNTVADMLAEAGLHNSVRAMRDGSIEVDAEYPHQIEFCILSKFSELDKTLEAVKKIITPENFEANESCGFHVHLDARQRDVKRMFHNLVCMQNLLFNMAAEHRQDSRYCNPLNTPVFDEVDERAEHAHWDAISKFAFYKHQTIEVRIHESTTDLTNVSKWVKLLKRISDYAGEPLKFGSLATSLEQLPKIKLEPEILEYVKEKRIV